MLTEAICLGVLIGLFLGALGGGGGVLVVPALVYVLGQSAQEATTGSIVIVGLTAVAGAAVRLRGGLVNWKIGLAFGVIGIPAAYVGTLLNHYVPQHTLMLAFAALTLAAALAMFLGTRSSGDGDDQGDDARGAARQAVPAVASPRSDAGAALLTAEPVTLTRERRTVLVAKVVVCGLAVGFLTGFLGVGGGFLVVPALVIALRMPMNFAVGTSLMIIAVNSVSSLLARVGVAHFDWKILVPFTLAAIVASGGGKRIADRLSGAALTQAFAVLLAMVGVLVGAQSLGAF
jgi:uncharacterized membrane protein YfcA